MPTGIAFIRGINVGGKNKLPMASLRELCAQAGLADAKTYIQSGNVVFRAEAKRIPKAGAILADAIESRFKFRPGVSVRSLDDVRRVVAENPFAGRRGADGGRLLVMFLSETPTAAAARALRSIKTDPEELVLSGREIYLHFPNGVAESNLPMDAVEKAIGVPGTCRNWNTIQSVIELAESLGT